MHKITINLLPPELKQETLILKRKGMSRSFCISLVLIILVFLISFLLVSNYFLISEFSLKEGLEKKYQEYLNLEENKELIKKADELKKLQDVEDKVQKERISISNILVELDKVIPSGIQITTFKVSELTQEVLIEGIAKERKNLLDFTSSLKTSEKFKDVQSPTASLIQKFDINFLIKAKLAQANQ